MRILVLTTAALLLALAGCGGNPRRPVQPLEVAEYVVEGILSDTFWIMPGPRHADVAANFDDIIRARTKSLLERSDPLQYLQKPT